MPWSKAQRERLAAEKSVLDHYFPGCVKWIDPTGDTKVEVTLKTNNDNEYTVRIYIGDFPNSVPDMAVVSSPRRMPEEWKSGSYVNHTLKQRDGYLRICHYHSSQWNDRSSLYEVVIKGRVWLEAYEGHLRTGQPMNYFLREMGNSSSTSPSSAAASPSVRQETDSQKCIIC
jgi:hypothetical protein